MSATVVTPTTPIQATPPRGRRHLTRCWKHPSDPYPDPSLNTTPFSPPPAYDSLPQLSFALTTPPPSSRGLTLRSSIELLEERFAPPPPYPNATAFSDPKYHGPGPLGRGLLPSLEILPRSSPSQQLRKRPSSTATAASTAPDKRSKMPKRGPGDAARRMAQFTFAAQADEDDTRRRRCSTPESPKGPELNLEFPRLEGGAILEPSPRRIPRSRC
jgi:hypothetical protein